MTPWGTERTASILLAGGRGTRMRSDQTHKVCFEIGGVPVILRALQSYQQCGIDQHVIVVGALGDQVLHTVGPRYSNVSFVYQPQPRGTGHATRCGANLLRNLGFDGLVLVTVSDRLTVPYMVHRLFATLTESGSDVVFLTGSREDNPSSGRVVLDKSGNAAGIVETSEIALSRLTADLEETLEAASGKVPAEDLLDRIRTCFPSDQKALKACGELYTQAALGGLLRTDTVRDLLQPLREKTNLTLWMDGTQRSLRPLDVEAMTDQVNLSTYLFRAQALYDALDTLASDNAQQEEYITDCIKNLNATRLADGSARYRLRTVAVDHPDASLAFNTPEELAAIERKLRLSFVDERGEETGEVVSPIALRPAREWQQHLVGNSPQVQRFMETIYGPVPSLHEEKRHELLMAVDHFIKLHGPDREVLLVRSPGRVNLMGRHIDHRGGHTNVVAISDEILMVASPREDDHVLLHNTNERDFAPAEFSIAKDVANLDWSDWLTCVNSPKTLAMVSNGGWLNYVRAAALRLQERFRGHALLGADVVTHGTIPVGSGLSSSSAVVVAAAEVLIAVNRLPVRPNILVDLCGEGEWFVGTRGGAADHAAIKFARRGYVAHVGFFPFEVKEFLPFFPDYCVVVCNSGVQAKKSQNAKTTFNQKILGYVAGEIILKQVLPEFASSIHHLRDITCENLGLRLEELYAALKQLPLTLTRDQLAAEYGPFSPADARKINTLLSGLPDDSAEFDVRGVTLFGLAEMERARRCFEYLRSGDAVGFGRLCYLSHDGDRVLSYDEDLQPRPWDYTVDDAALDALIARLQSADAEQIAAAQLYLQPGQYACSTPEIDLIVDLARRQEGVVGAQLAGAGLGGCAVILVRDDKADAVIGALAAQGFQAHRYYPVEGAGLVEP